jgi:hypothetical protein
MPWTNQHLKWLEDTGERITTACGKEAPIYTFNPDMTDEITLSAWAKHFRNHYCDDNEIDELRDGTGLSREEYLLQLKLPVQKISEPHERTGPGTRSGDFSEILVSDFLEFNLNYWVPRTRYEFKVNPNLSENGSDVIGFKFSSDENPKKDELMIYEVKGSLTGNKPINRLQVAVKDSDKDRFRVAESLNSIKQRLKLKGFQGDVPKVQRFQNPADRPYIEQYGAAAVLTNSMYSDDELAKTDSSEHVNNSSLSLLVIKGEALMDLAHFLYQRAANEA